MGETLPVVSSSDIFMVDELWHYINRKKKVWIWRAIDGVSHQSLGWEVGSRGDGCPKRLLLRHSGRLIDLDR